MDIETALTPRLPLHLPFRQTEGFLLSIFELMDVHLEAPDHTTISRRSAALDVPPRSRRATGAIDLVVDSSGLVIFVDGQWAAVKHGGKGIQGWRKLHLGVDETGVIVAQALTSANVNAAATGISLIGEVSSRMKTVIADGAYDTRTFHASAESKAARVVVPRDKTATVGGEQSRFDSCNNASNQCGVWQNPVVFVPVTIDSAGRAETSLLAVPSNSTPIGTPLTFQWLVLYAKANAFGGVTTEALDVVMGR